MAESPWTWFNEAVEHVDADEMGADSYSAVLCTATQAIDADFVGASGNCTYADLTAELSTANGYTSGGQVISGITLTRVVNLIKWTFSSVSWTLSGTINFRYIILKNNVDGRLIAFSDVLVGGGASNLSATTGVLGFTTTAGSVLTLTRV